MTSAAAVVTEEERRRRDAEQARQIAKANERELRGSGRIALQPLV